MKKFLLIGILFILFVFNSYSATFLNFYDFKQLSYNLKSDEDFMEEFYKTHIPSEYADAFLYYTKDINEIDPKFRIEFYSIMFHESGNFRSFVNKNKNGSYDYGPSQLNSKNIENKRFMTAFTPKDKSHITSKYCLYMIISINFYWDLKNTWSNYALYAYNGGPKAARIIKNNIQDPRYANLVKNVKRYNYSVRNNIKKFNIELAKYVKNSRSELVESLRKQFEEDYFQMIVLNSKKSSNIKNHNKFINDMILYYIREKNLADLQSEEIIIKLDIIAGTFQYQFAESNIA